MNIDDIFTKTETFSTPVTIKIPGDGKDRVFRPTVKFRYITQEQLDALLNGESAEINGTTVEAEDDAGLLDQVLAGWTGWKVSGEDIQYDEANHAKALNHIPIRAPMIKTFFERIAGGETGRRGKRKNS